MKLRLRMMLLFLGVAGLGLVSLLWWVDRTVRPVYLDSVEDSLVDISNLLAAQLSMDARFGELDLEPLQTTLNATGDRRFEAHIYDRMKRSVEWRVYVTDARGMVVFDSDDGRAVGQDYSEWNDVKRTLEGRYGARASWIEKPDGQRVLVLYSAAPIIVDGSLLGSVSVSKSTEAIYPYYQAARDRAMLGILVAGGLVLIWGIFITLWVTNPIHRLTDYAQAVRDGERLAAPELGKSEIGSLARAFDEMREALDGRKYAEQFVQTLTHEIKSPLSAIRGAAELIDDQMSPERRNAFMDNIRIEANRIQRLVERLLELSALESRRALNHPAEVDLGELIDETLASMAPAFEAKALERSVQAPQTPVRVFGERFLLGLALSNLLQNAIDFTPNGGEIEIGFGNHSVRIADSGPGIPEYAQTRIFERFYSLRRVDTGHKSSGLGLAIVRQVAELHQGGIQLRNRPKGGAEAILWFPHA